MLADACNTTALSAIQALKHGLLLKVPQLCQGLHLHACLLTHLWTSVYLFRGDEHFYLGLY